MAPSGYEVCLNPAAARLPNDANGHQGLRCGIEPVVKMGEWRRGTLDEHGTGNVANRWVMHFITKVIFRDVVLGVIGAGTVTGLGTLTGLMEHVLIGYPVMRLDEAITVGARAAELNYAGMRTQVIVSMKRQRRSRWRRGMTLAPTSCPGNGRRRGSTSRTSRRAERRREPRSSEEGLSSPVLRSRRTHFRRLVGQLSMRNEYG